MTALARLRRVLSRHDALAIAVSGGVDSMTLAHVAQGCTRATMIHAVSPAVPAEATSRVRRHAREEGWHLRIVDAGEFGDPRYRANPLDRCYFCKLNLYSTIRGLTDGPVASGTNRDDLDDFRPGLAAAGELQVCHPYVEAGIGKEVIYRLALDLGCATWRRCRRSPALPAGSRPTCRWNPPTLRSWKRSKAGCATHWARGPRCAAASPAMELSWNTALATTDRKPRVSLRRPVLTAGALSLARAPTGAARAFLRSEAE